METEKISGWCKFVNFINSHDIGDEISRKDMVKILDIQGSTLDNYRLGINDLNYIRRVRRGVFVLVEKVPGYITSANFRNKEEIESAKKRKMFEII